MESSPARFTPPVFFVYQPLRWNVAWWLMWHERKQHDSLGCWYLGLTFFHLGKHIEKYHCGCFFGIFSCWKLTVERLFSNVFDQKGCRGFPCVFVMAKVISSGFGADVFYFLLGVACEAVGNLPTPIQLENPPTLVLWLRSLHLDAFGRCTPPKTNMSPENQWLEDVFPTKIVHFEGTC